MPCGRRLIRRNTQLEFLFICIDMSEAQIPETAAACGRKIRSWAF